MSKKGYWDTKEWTTGKWIGFVLVILFLIALIAWAYRSSWGPFSGRKQVSDPVPSAPTASAPNLKKFEADKTRITAGESVTLTWECERGLPLIAGDGIDPETRRNPLGSETIEFPDPGTFRIFATCVERVAGESIVMTVDPVPPSDVTKAPDPAPAPTPDPTPVPAQVPGPAGPQGPPGPPGKDAVAVVLTAPPAAPAPVIVWGTSQFLNVPYGSELMLSWGVGGATECVRKNAWSGPAPLEGQMGVGPLHGPRTLVFELSCDGPGGPATSKVTVVVGAPPPLPTPVVIISPPAPAPTPAPAVKTFTANTTSITAGKSVMFRWECENAQVGLLAGIPVLDPEKERGVSGSEIVIFPIPGTFNITTTCVADGRQTSRSITVTVTELTPPPILLVAQPSAVLSAWREPDPFGGVRIWATSTVVQDHRFWVRCSSAAEQNVEVVAAGVQQLLRTCIGVVSPEVRLEKLVNGSWTHVQTIRP